MGIVRDWVLNPYACYTSPYPYYALEAKNGKLLEKFLKIMERKEGKPIFLWLSLLADPQAEAGGGCKGGRSLPVHFTLAAAACFCYPLSSDSFVIVILFSPQSNCILSPAEMVMYSKDKNKR